MRSHNTVVISMFQRTERLNNLLIISEKLNYEYNELYLKRQQ
jgi:hypothetical protein